MGMIRISLMAVVAALTSSAAVSSVAQELPLGTDSVFVEAYESCMDGASGGLPPESRGWISHDTGNVDAQAWNNWTAAFATLDDILGVGGMDLYATIETYVGYKVGTCEVTMQKPSRFIVAPDLDGNGFIVELEVGAEDWSGTWRTEDANLFIRAGMSTNAERFRLSVLQIIRE
jgi:hypothetical protein